MNPQLPNPQIMRDDCTVSAINQEIFLHCSDDSLGYEFPFVLRVVEREGLQCAWCPWYKFCRGCQLPCEDKMFPQNAAFLAIDWDPTALHLRYQSGLERVSMIWILLCAFNQYHLLCALASF